MAAFYHAFAWRLGLPASIACVGSHYLIRFDDGKIQYNYEATPSGFGGFKSDPDEYVIAKYSLPEIAISSGSDLRALTAREVLGVNYSMKARHLRDVGLLAGSLEQILLSEPEWLLARHLMPSKRMVYRNQMSVSLLRDESLFLPTETGHPRTLVAEF